MLIQRKRDGRKVWADESVDYFDYMICRGCNKLKFGGCPILADLFALEDKHGVKVPICECPDYIPEAWEKNY